MSKLVLTPFLVFFSFLSLGQNLIVNGNLESGDPFINGTAYSDFINSCTQYYMGHYCYSNDMSSKYGFPTKQDHSPGVGEEYMLIFDGTLDNTKRIVYGTSYNFQWGITYEFEFYAHHRFSSNQGGDVLLDVFVNNQNIGSVNIVGGNGWQSFKFNLGNQLSGVQSIEIRQKNTGHYNDFALDDISLTGNNFVPVISGVNENSEALDLTQDFLDVYPNPARSVVNLKWNIEFAPSEVAILELDGRIISNYVVDSGSESKKINIQHLAPGFYIVKLRNNQREQIKYLVVM